MNKGLSAFVAYMAILKKRKNNFQKVIARLPYAWEEVRKHPHKATSGSDGENIFTFTQDYSSKLASIAEKLLEGTFKFKPLKRVLIDEGKREILIQNIDERIVSEAILGTVSPYLEKLNSNHDFSRRVKHNLTGDEEIDFDGIPLAVKIIQDHFKAGFVWVLEADIKKFFDNVPKKRLWEIIIKKIKNKKLLSLIEQIINFSVAKKEGHVKVYDNEKGIAQGSALSPLLASIYLYEFDMFISKFPDVKLVRFVDDFIILAKSEQSAHAMYDLVNKKLREMGLDIYQLGEVSDKGAEKTKIICVKGRGASAFDFLGLSFNHLDVDICRKKKDKINLKIKEIIYSDGLSFFIKTRQIESRLMGYIDHYRKPHYSRTVASLNKIISFSQQELRNYYVETYKKIAGKYPFIKLTPELVDRLFKFMGIDFRHLVTKTNTPTSFKKFSSRK